jgi:hypothetical protein
MTSFTILYLASNGFIPIVMFLHLDYSTCKGNATISAIVSRVGTTSLHQPVGSKARLQPKKRIKVILEEANADALTSIAFNFSVAPTLRE